MRLSLLAAASAATSLAYAAPSLRATFVPGQTASYVASPAPLQQAKGAPAQVDSSYIVVLKKDVDPTTFLAHQALIAGVQAQALAYSSSSSSTKDHGLRHIYNLPGHLQGYSGKFTQDVLQFIRAQPEIEYVEQDSVVHTTMMKDDGSRIQDVDFAAEAKLAAADNHEVEKGAPWGLARISHRSELGFGTFNKYVYDSTAGEGVVAYIIDTGIYINHTDFEGRARWGKTMPQNDVDADGNGHGTHCAGTIASKTYGVAKKAEVVAVKVLGSGGSGTMADVTAGVLWAVNDAKEASLQIAANPHSEKAKKHKGFVANMSLGGGVSPTLDRAVNGAVDSGLHFAVAAGNENQDACNTSPARSPNPLTVGASTIADERAYFSNIGKCVDIFAPGLNIKSTWNAGPNSINVISGTSMATPHIVGMLAYYLSIYGSTDFAEVKDAIPMPAFGERALALQQQKPVQALAKGAHSLLSSLPFSGLIADWLADSFLLHEPSFERPAAAKSGTEVYSVLHPQDMKKAFEKLATKDALAKLDSASPNLLAFNNATRSGDLH